MTDSRIVVVGGGLAGLTAARHLAADGFDVTLFEREEDVGGRVRSRRGDGFVFDRGFQVLFTAYPAARRELDFDALDLRAFSAGATICRGDQRSVLADPLREPGALAETLFNSEVSAMDKLRTVRLRADLKSKSVEDIFAEPDATIEQYLYAYGFSERYVDRFVRPFYGGITLDRDLDTSKRVFEFTFKMLSEGKTVIPAGGMGAIARQLVDAAIEQDARIVTETPVEGVAPGDAAVDVQIPGETVDADAVVVAADPKSSRELAGVDAIPTDARGCVTQHFAVPSGHPLADSDRIHLNAGGEVPTTVAPLSGVAPEYAPDGRALVAATTVGHEDAGDDVRVESDGDLETRTRETLAGWYPAASLGDFELLRTDRLPFAQFAQPPGVHESLPDVRAPDGAVYLAGDYTHDSSINGALESGNAAADAVSADLQ
ncbi:MULTISPECIES: NAD(P)/FAD-dependent oxidoreductase [Halobacterium]|uniref:NAD(P)/FAD-dependent oxidoreductase n=1 Tax=Halobacterium TaxID=2239 RepID=UPI00073F6003|nr:MULTISPECIES: NAD(P)/FAD-dependent oxidoreductase [Halobacterium]MCG1002538.1 FAD-dependent oxidoreductase [Halobacterium noricense]